LSYSNDNDSNNISKNFSSRDRDSTDHSNNDDNDDSRRCNDDNNDIVIANTDNIYNDTIIGWYNNNNDGKWQ
jgi:hypothetical protein